MFKYRCINNMLAIRSILLPMMLLLATIAIGNWQQFVANDSQLKSEMWRRILLEKRFCVSFEIRKCYDVTQRFLDL